MISFLSAICLDCAVFSSSMLESMYLQSLYSMAEIVYTIGSVVKDVGCKNFSVCGSISHANVALSPQYLLQ